MKHCAKKLLGLAFALALCLAVGGNALADGPEAADVWMLSDVWMLADEPNVTTAPDTTTVGDLANDGYTVTIPKTVEVDSTTNEGTLTVTAQMKQWRTLDIAITPQDNKWTLKYQGATGENMPEVAYQLPQEIVGAEDYFSWLYHNEHQNLTFMTSKLGGSEDVSKDKIITAKLAVTVPNSEEATMSGTYADTLTFYITPGKLCVTYNINVYEQKLVTQTDGWNNNGNVRYCAVNVVDVVDESGNVEEGAKRNCTVIREYLKSDAGPYTWTRPRPAGTEGDEDTRCWEDLSYTMTPEEDYKAGKTTQTINLNLKRKWYWLDVNGIVNYTGSESESTDGNGPVGCYLDIRVSGDEGITWSPWYWYKNGDDYWGTFPYGTTFEIGFHHPKEGYVYDTDESGNVKVIANGEIKYTTKEIDNSSAGQTKIYKVFAGKLTDAPREDKLINTTDGGNYHAEGNYQRYCFNVCCLNNTIVYARNDGTETTETQKYDENAALPKYDAVFDSVQDGAVFMGWSTEQTVTSEDKLYQPGVAVTKVQWTDESHKRLYAIWGRKVDITIQFEDEKGYTDDNGEAHVSNTVMEDRVILTDQTVLPGGSWTLDLSAENVPTDVINTIEAATEVAKKAAGDTRAATDKDTVWKIAEKFVKNGDCTISVPTNVSAGQTLTLTIKRRRYLLSVISVDADTDGVHGIATNSNDTKYGTFTVTVNGKIESEGKSFYQCGWNYGASYEVSDKKGLENPDYQAGYFILESLAVDEPMTQISNSSSDDPYKNFLTGKKADVDYYRNGKRIQEHNLGDPIRVLFMKTSSSSDTPMPGPSLAPARKALTLRYHANFDPNEELALDLDPDPLLDDMDDTFGFDPDPLLEDVDDALEGAVKTVSYQPGEDVVLRNCMFKRSGYVFVGWNTEPDGTGRLYRVNGVPITDWAAGDTVDLYAQWKKPDHLKPVVDNEPFVPTDPDTPPEELDPGFGIDPDADPADEEGPADDADAVDDAPAVADEEAAAAPPEELDFGLGIDPDAAVGGPAPFVRW